MPRHKPGHLPGDPDLTGKAGYRKSSPAKKKAVAKVKSMDELMGPDWEDKGIKEFKPPAVPKRAVVKPKKKKFVSKRVIKKPKPLTAKQKKDQAEARARKKRAMKVLK